MFSVPTIHSPVKTEANVVGRIREQISLLETSGKLCRSFHQTMSETRRTYFIVSIKLLFSDITKRKTKYEGHMYV